MEFKFADIYHNNRWGRLSFLMSTVLVFLAGVLYYYSNMSGLGEFKVTYDYIGWVEIGDIALVLFVVSFGWFIASVTYLFTPLSKRKQGRDPYSYLRVYDERIEVLRPFTREVLMIPYKQIRGLKLEYKNDKLMLFSIKVYQGRNFLGFDKSKVLEYRLDSEGYYSLLDALQERFTGLVIRHRRNFA